MNFETVRKIGLALPGVEEGLSYGSPALKLRGKMICCLAIHRSAEPDTLVVMMDFTRRDELIAADPRTCYLTYHYEAHPVVLVRLARLRRDALQDLLQSAWQFVSARATRRKRKVSRPASAGLGPARRLVGARARKHVENREPEDD